jgi:hypothetical protein
MEEPEVENSSNKVIQEQLDNKDKDLSVKDVDPNLSDEQIAAVTLVIDQDNEINKITMSPTPSVTDLAHENEAKSDLAHDTETESESISKLHPLDVDFESPAVFVNPDEGTPAAEALAGNPNPNPNLNA